MGLQGRVQREPLLLRLWLAAPAELPALLPALVRLEGAQQECVLAEGWRQLWTSPEANSQDVSWGMEAPN